MLLHDLFKASRFIIQKINGLLVLRIVLDVVVFVLLVSLFRHQFGDEIGKLAFNSRRALAIELVIAEVDQQACQKIVLIADSQSQLLSNGLRNLVRIDAD